MKQLKTHIHRMVRTSPPGVRGVRDILTCVAPDLEQMAVMDPAPSCPKFLSPLLYHLGSNTTSDTALLSSDRAAFALKQVVDNNLLGDILGAAAAEPAHVLSIDAIQIYQALEGVQLDEQKRRQEHGDATQEQGQFLGAW